MGGVLIYACSRRFLVLFILYVIALEGNEVDRINWSEGIFMLYALGKTPSTYPSHLFGLNRVSPAYRIYFGQSGCDAGTWDERSVDFVLMTSFDSLTTYWYSLLGQSVERIRHCVHHHLHVIRKLPSLRSILLRTMGENSRYRYSCIECLSHVPSVSRIVSNTKRLLILAKA